jgi:FkbM family methyltransferase
LLLDSAPPDSSDDSGPVLTKPPSRLSGTAVGDFGGKYLCTFHSGLRNSSEYRPGYSLLPHLYQDALKIAFPIASGQIPSEVYCGFRQSDFIPMNARLQYEIRGWAYWAKCFNPLRNTITIGDLPLGLQLRAYKRDAVGRGLYRRKVHEPSITKFLLTRFANSPEKNFIDAGANIGYFSCLMGKLAGPAGQVVAIEPEPQNLKLLEQNIKLNNLTNVMIHSCALGASEGSAMLGLYKASNRGRHSILERDAKSRIKVPVRTLDDLVRNSGKKVRSWSLVKIDVEGYEGFVLDGARDTLPLIEILIMEFTPALLKKAGGDPVKTLDILTRCFSHIYRIEGTGLMEVTAEECLGSDNQVELVFER